VASKKKSNSEQTAVVQEMPVVKRLPDVVSYSKLTTYDRCSELFKLKYIQGIPESREDTLATRLGSICHTAIEQFYEDGGETIETPYHALTRENGVWYQELASNNLLIIFKELQTYGHHITKLYWRASAKYTGPDKIRKADGSVSTSPHLTTAWKTYIKNNALDRMAHHIDQVAARVAKDRWTGISLSEVYSQSLGILYPYVNPPEVYAVVAIELAISDIKLQAATFDGKPMIDEDGHPVPTSRSRGPYPVFIDPEHTRGRLIEIENEFYLPAVDLNGKLVKDEKGNIVFRNDVLFTGFIDLLARDEQGRLYIIDHKTSRELPTPSKVSRHEQLLVYGFIIHHLFEETPYAIGINHLRSGNLVTAPFDLEKAEKAVERLASIVRGIELSAYVKKDPDAYMTMCVIKSSRDSEPPTLCPGLRYCHPDVFKQYTNVLDTLDF
jgi:hypothetical protein